MTDIHNPDDQLATLKAWWRQYGAALLGGVVIGLVLLAGIKYWQHYQTERGEAASVLYDSVLMQLAEGRREEAEAGAARLVAEYAATPYAGKAALLAAGIRYDARDRPAARAHLEWAAERAREPAVRHSARIRLGYLLIELGEIDAALALAAPGKTDGFASEYAELRGDALLARGDRDGARAAYQAAYEALPPQSPYARLLGMKRDDLGPGPQS